MKKISAGLIALALATGGTLVAAGPASATEGHVGIQDYIVGCDLPNRTAQFGLDALGADTATTYVVSDGTPAATVVVAPHSFERSPAFSIPASGASYTVTASTGQSWSFTAAPDCIPVVTPPVVVPPVVEPPVETEPPVTEPPVVVDPPVTPEEPPVVVPPVVETPDEEIVTATVVWQMPEGTKAGEVKYDQTYITSAEGNQLEALSKKVIAENCGLYQIDVYEGTKTQIEALYADKKLTKGEDSKLYRSHKLVEGKKCTIVTPPVVTPPVVTPPVVTPPVVTPPVVTPPVVTPPVVTPPVTESPDVTPIDEIGNKPVIEEKTAEPVVVTVLEEASTPVISAKKVSAPVETEEGLAYTGSEHVAGGIAAGVLALLAGVGMVLRRRVS